MTNYKNAAIKFIPVSILIVFGWIIIFLYILSTLGEIFLFLFHYLLIFFLISYDLCLMLNMYLCYSFI